MHCIVYWVEEGRQSNEMANVSNNVTTLGLPEISAVGTILSFFMQKGCFGFLVDDGD